MSALISNYVKQCIYYVENQAFGACAREIVVVSAAELVRCDLLIPEIPSVDEGEENAQHHYHLAPDFEFVADMLTMPTQTQEEVSQRP